MEDITKGFVRYTLKGNKPVETVFSNQKERKLGRTTRLIDEYVQELFTKGKIFVKDHDAGKKEYQLDYDRNLMRILVGRLQNEHGQNQYSINYAMRTVELVIEKEKEQPRLSLKARL